MKDLLCSTLRATLALACTVAATTTAFTANYDSLTTTEAGAPAALGTYGFLSYSAFSVLTDALGLVGGFAPRSRPVFAGAYAQTATTPGVTVAPPYRTFGPEGFFWFGCDVNADDGVVDVAARCTVTVAAFEEAGGREVAVASFTFARPESPVAQVPMAQAVLPDGFENVYRVTVVQDDPAVAFGIDDVEYTVST